ncbi:MOSC domain-containing protein [Oceaniferula marina]|nr:MOSC domain-containing protein [Oceaniferula marina]
MSKLPLFLFFCQGIIQGMQVQIKHLFISTGHNYYGRHGKGAMDYAIEEAESIECVAGSGIVGDRFFDYKPDYKGQITLFDWAVYERVRDEIVKGDLHPRAFRRNVVVEGVDLNTLIDKRFSLGDLELTGSCECAPCYWMDQACAPGTHEFLKGQGGLRARIVQGGELASGVYDLDVLGGV